MLACPLFCKFGKLNKTAELKGMNIDTIATLVLKTCNWLITKLQYCCVYTGTSNVRVTSMAEKTHCLINKFLKQNY